MGHGHAVVAVVLVASLRLQSSLLRCGLSHCRRCQSMSLPSLLWSFSLLHRRLVAVLLVIVAIVIVLLLLWSLGLIDYHTAKR